MTSATGTFEVKLVPEANLAAGEGPALGRMSLTKVWHGDLEATSSGTMLTASSNERNSAAYVAAERVTGALNGRRGTFALAHMGIMNRGVPSLTITVVPDSGTGELSGLSGTLRIEIENGRHSYEFEFALPPA
ncbi:MAG: hypothetical protein MNPFHGCM_02701 [Gemmatimonadaceae bacterium]|nr:hypothetical protein [Gemmatimonadaceae bacterium]